MFITAEAVPVYLALIGLATLIIQNIFTNKARVAADAMASKERAMAAEKLTEIHTLTNSGMSDVKGQLATALGRIDELNKAAVMARVPVSPPLPQSLPPAAPEPTRPTLVKAATAAGVAAATAVADAAVDKKDEIVGPKK